MNRYESIVLKAEQGIIFNVSEGLNGEVIIKACNIATGNVYSDNYANPPIPEGYKHIEGTWDKGFVIESPSGNQFVWIPVGYLDDDGTLDGNVFTEKFGRRGYQKNECKEFSYYERVRELCEQLESVKKYGGFYISRYNISKNSEGKPQSVKGAMPWVDITCEDAKDIAADIEKSKSVTSHLTLGAEYDSILAWLIKSGARTSKEVFENSSGWGNYWNAIHAPKKVVKTGAYSKWSANNIYDLAGNVDEWTQEICDEIFCVVRGGYFLTLGEIFSVNARTNHPDYDSSDHTGFRAALWIK